VPIQQAITPDPIAVTLPVGAAMLGCTTRALRTLIWAGKIRYVKLGKRFVIQVAELRAFMEKESVRA
jgi:excisionase family DNA binding protein